MGLHADDGCVSVSVCVYVCHKAEIYRKGLTDRARFGAEVFLRPVLHTGCYKEISVSPT